MAAPLTLEVAGHAVTVTHPDRVVFGAIGVTKLDLVHYYLAVADGALRGVAHRPMILRRFVRGVEQEAVFQKRAPARRPDFVTVAELRYASGTSAAEAVVSDAAGLVWAVNLGCVDLNPHPVRADDLDHPDELRIDLDPMPGVPWRQVVEVAHVVRAVLADHGLTGWPKTSGSRGFHVYAAIEPHWPFTAVRRAAEAVAREVARRAPQAATARWHKEERHGVFVDFNQNAKDRTMASAYSVRAVPDARVSTPLRWDEVDDADPAAFTIATVPQRFSALGDPWEGMADRPGSLQPLLELAERLGPAERAAERPPLIEVARTRTRPEALAALENWRRRHPAAAARLAPADVLVDGMRGPSSLWYRVRINLQHVPEALRPQQEPLITDYDPWRRPGRRPRN
ncbi:non-homologous end-joining DNA ligase [uncultured Mycolicibacterium sp.]|uniref:non-homologous end-joining DNA ligase n=1 Tax=uncultured Mycolicibacterium sp. TaxID=2320817 RepID=UPI0026325B9B|nr:non-homologous end-joining DNA ligase [uncultured Mycolicibacterium sp.]